MNRPMDQKARPEIFTQDQRQTGEWIRKISATSHRRWKAFYHTGQWKAKRLEILKRDHGECQRCRYRKRPAMYTPATVVHHIKHLKEFPELALTDSNLESLCADCHEQEHPERHHRKEEKFVTPERW